VVPQADLQLPAQAADVWALAKLVTKKLKPKNSPNRRESEYMFLLENFFILKIATLASKKCF
jgi:hypothetical protein